MARPGLLPDLGGKADRVAAQPPRRSALRNLARFDVGPHHPQPLREKAGKFTLQMRVPAQVPRREGAVQGGGQPGGQGHPVEVGNETTTTSVAHSKVSVANLTAAAVRISAGSLVVAADSGPSDGR